MENKPAAKSKNKILKFLPRAVSSITFQNLPFSPGRNTKSVVKTDNKLKSRHEKQFSGPKLSIVPAEGGRDSNNSGYEPQEPTSPKISCMGHIKHRKKLAKNMNLDGLKNKPSVMKNVLFLSEANKIPPRMLQNSGLNSLKPGRKSDASSGKSTNFHDGVPKLSQMKRSASFHGSLANFDAKMAQIELDEEEKVVVDFFAQTIVDDDGGEIPVGLKLRKEINLWKRRTIAKPEPIKVNTMLRIQR